MRREGEQARHTAAYRANPWRGGIRDSAAQKEADVVLTRLGRRREGCTPRTGRTASFVAGPSPKPAEMPSPMEGEDTDHDGGA